MSLRERYRKVFGVVLKHTLNPLTRRMARTRFGPFAIVQHIGRRSGKTYETPIIVQPIRDGFMIELTYGPNVDWYKNVQTAGGCIILWHSKAYIINKVEPLDPVSGRAAFPLPLRIIMDLLNLKHFAKMSMQAPIEKAA
jgi:deazaflavin-dependent oxidoreductase (nitroreductase family)